MMTPKKFNFKPLKKKLVDLQDAMENAIINEMDRLNIGVISFIRNGDSAEFNIERVFALESTWDEPIYGEVVALIKANNTLSIIIDDTNIGTKTLTLLEEADLFPQSDLNNKKFRNTIIENAIPIVDTLMPTSTLSDLCGAMMSIQKMIQTPITKRVYID